jgi:hypothetical protein
MASQSKEHNFLGSLKTHAKVILMRCEGQFQAEYLKGRE